MYLFPECQHALIFKPLPRPFSIFESRLSKTILLLQTTAYHRSNLHISTDFSNSNIVARYCVISQFRNSSRKLYKMPGEIDPRGPDRAAASPFDSPEVVARFNSCGPWNASPTPRPRLPTALSQSHSSPAWNLGPLGALTNGRAVSAGSRALPSTKDTGSVNGKSANHVTEAQWARYQQLKAADCAKNDLIEVGIPPVKLRVA